MAELFFNIRERNAGILHHVVQKGRGNRLIVHSQLDENLGNGERMDNIRLPRAPLLLPMGGGGKGISLLDELQIIIFAGLPDKVLKLLKGKGIAFVLIAHIAATSSFRIDEFSSRTFAAQGTTERHSPSPQGFFSNRPSSSITERAMRNRT